MRVLVATQSVAGADVVMTVGAELIIEVEVHVKQREQLMLWRQACCEHTFQILKVEQLWE